MARKSKITYQPKARTVFIALAIAAVMLGGLYAALQYLMPAQSYVGSDRNYGYVYSSARNSSTAFSLASAESDAMLLFGSSELSISTATIPEVPAAVLGLRNYGLQLNYVGEAYDQSLWHAIAAGAYSQGATNRKVAIIVSPAWFNDGGVDNETFKLRFSYTLYQQFCSNPDISQESRDYVKRRLAEQGVDDATINAGLGTYPHDVINSVVLSALDDLKIRKDLVEVRDLGIDTSNVKNQTPTFSAWRNHALEDAVKASTNNDWGFLDSFYEQNVAGKESQLRGLQASDTYSDTPEYDDFAFFLQVCKEVGFEPLVIISPVSGYFYDLEGVSSSTRFDCYERIRATCAEYGVSVADFSDREYEKYFLFDAVHFGWTGWVDVEEALVEFASK